MCDLTPCCDACRNLHRCGHNTHTPITLLCMNQIPVLETASTGSYNMMCTLWLTLWVPTYTNYYVPSICDVDTVIKTSYDDHPVGNTMSVKINNSQNILNVCDQHNMSKE